MGKICFSKNLCMDKSLLFLIIIVAIGILVYDHYMLKKEIKESQHTQQNKTNTMDTSNKVVIEEPKTEIVNVHTPIHHPPTIGQVLKNYDYKMLEDPLTPPFKRDDYMVPAQIVRPDVFGLYTSGAPGTFRKMGYVKSINGNNDYKYLNLIGRPKYNGSTIYEYYVTSTNRDDSIKFYLNKYKRELYDGDKIKIPQIGSEEYEVIIDKNLDLEYNPLIY